MSKKNWFANKMGWLGACVGMLCMGLVACATSEPSVSKPTQPGFDEISAVRTERDGASTVVILGGLHGTQYTAYPDEDFNLVVIEVPSATLGASLQKQLSVYDGVVREVSVAPFTMRTGEPLARVEISLAEDSTFEVVPSGDHLKVRITPAAAVAANAGAAATEAATVAEAADAAPTVTPASADAPIAKTLQKVESQGSADGTVLYFRGDGKISEFTSFVLSDPARLVIDLAGIKNQASPLKVAVDSGHVASVRLGAHPDKVRVVIDAGSAAAPFEGRWIVPTNDGLLVTLGAGASVDAALAAANSGVAQAAPVAAEQPVVVASEEPAASSEVVEAAPVEEQPTQESVGSVAQPVVAAMDGAQVYGVSHERLATADRVVISASQPVEYRVFKPNAETVMLSLANAQVSEAAAGRITPEQGGSIAMVSTFQQPDVRTPEVRVVLTRASGVEPQITRDGSMIIVDVANDKVAVLPPAMTKDEAAPVAADASALTVPQAGGAEDGSTAPSGIAQDGSTKVGVACQIGQEQVVLSESGRVYCGTPISLDFRDAEIRSVLQLIADASNFNIMVTDDVDGKVTIRLKNTPWDAAFDNLLAITGLAFKRMPGNVLRVGPAAVLRKAELTELEHLNELKKLGDLEVRRFSINYGSAETVSKLVEDLLIKGGKERGTAKIDRRTNAVFVKARREVLDEVERLVKRIDRQTPQVMIDAKFVEASLDFSYSIGTQWSVDQGVGSSAMSEDFDILAGGVLIGKAMTLAPDATLGFAATALDAALDLSFTLQLAESAGSGKVISSPRVVSLNNEKAKIEQSIEIPYTTQKVSDTGTGTATITYTVEFKKAPLLLEVVPHITDNDSINMVLKMTLDRPNYARATPAGPPIDRNLIETEVLVVDGQTLVLGGVYVTTDEASEDRMPFVHKIPLLGALFKQRIEVKNRKELLVFVTPRIVRSPAVTG